MIADRGPNPSVTRLLKDFQLETDASGESLGAVLAQKQDDGSVKPIAFASRTLQPHERNYWVRDGGLRSCLGSEAVSALLVQSSMHSVY